MNIASASQSRAQGPIVSSRFPGVSSNLPSRHQPSSASRNYLVFPVQLGHKKSPLEAFPFTSYTTIDLKARHSYDPSLSQQIGDIWVKTASYYKQKQNPQHEFIVFSVTASNGMQNFLALDRNVNSPGSSTLLSRSKSGPPAQDYFHVSHYGDMESLINHCAHTTSEDLCNHVEQVVFGRKAFSFAELVVLASTVSESCPSYQLDAANCYWFASLIWECMLGLFEQGMVIHKKNSDDRGKFKGFRIQGDHSNFKQVIHKYKDDIVQFSNDVLSVPDRRSRKISTMTSNRPDLEKIQASTLAPPAESRSRTVSASSSVTLLNGARPPATSKESDRRTERTRATSLCPTGKTQDPAARLSLNKDLPSLPPSAPTSQPARSRTHPVDDRRSSRDFTNEYAFLSAPLPEAVSKGSNRYSDIGKSFEQATAALSHPANRPASSYTAPAQKQVSFDSSPRVQDNARLKVISLPSRPSSPGSDPNKDRSRSPSLPVGSTPPEIRHSEKESRNSISQPSAEPAQRARTTSGLQRLRRALPKLLLPTVAESEDAICESPELSSWTEIESPEYEEDHPFADGASERLSYIEFPQPPGPPGLPAPQAVSSPPGIRVARGHRVHPSRVEYADGTRKRKSQDSGEERDSKSFAPRS
ncbi:unnamed protein product [Rhizoctonia solani]|uniref:Uncharacterized protein n=1 Tax=Rhizoctonia solani TaxID=456999 RepID=A0A8H3DQ83_9AGAM|nr:unnamed protein product [Rhizoctonia solani]